MNHKEYTPFKNIDELWNRIGDNCVHPKKEDILDVPPKIYESYKLELTKEQRDLYLQLQNQHCTDHITVDNGLKLYLRFQDICNGYEPVETDELDKNGNPKVELVPLKENPKLDWLEEYIESLGNEQCLVWCARSRLLHDACARMRDKGYTCGIYDGKVGTENRERDYEDFYNGKIQILFLNQASGGYGLDKLRNANYGIYLCNDASVEKRQQSEDRCCRGVYKDSKFMIDISMEGTVEQKVTTALKQGKELVDSGVTDASLFLLEE
jgi:SNF2 family DNA or RNA helicase